MSPLVWRVVRAGLVAALVVGASGRVLERVRFGASDADAAARVEAELRQRFDSSADDLGALAASVAADPAALRDAARDTTAARRLFTALENAIPNEDAGRTGITVYSPAGAPIAWAGRVSDMPRERLNGPAALFVAPGGLGPRLVRVEPIADPARPSAAPLAVVAVEQLLTRTPGAPGLADAFVISTSIAPVSLRAAYGDIAAGPPYQFVIPSRGGGALVTGDINPSELAQARARWRHGTTAAVLSVTAITLLLCAGPLVEWRRRARTTTAVVAASTGLVALLGLARAALWVATRSPGGARRFASPLDLLLTSLLAVAVAWLVFDLIERRRVAPPRVRLLASTAGKAARVAMMFALAGAADAWLLSTYGRFLAGIVSSTALDLLHFSLHPVNAPRLAVAFGLVLLHASVVWLAAAAIRWAALLTRSPRRSFATAAGALGWGAGAALAAWATRRVPLAMPVAPLLVGLGVSAVCAVVTGRVRVRARHMSQAARLGGLFLALLVPALAMYPSLFSFATSAKERLVATVFGPEAVSQREDLQQRLRHSLEQIDGLQSLADFVAPAGDATPPSADRAFLVWSQTQLATYRLTSSVELYDAAGRLVSRFALNLPEYTTSTHEPGGCEWDLIEEVSPFGSTERHVLRASRGICVGRREVGAIVVRAMLDYRALPFISSQSPYLESLRPGRSEPPEGVAGRDVEFAVYGWSGAPLFASGTSVWPLPESAFERMSRSREPMWATLASATGVSYRVYFRNDRGGVYALGYPIVTWFGHLVNLAELVTLTGVLYLVLLAGATLFNALMSPTPAGGRALLREVRSSFYRKLLLAFVAAAVLPVVILAIATRTYFAGQFRAGVEEAAAQTATVAQRLVEDYATFQQRGPGALDVLDDQIMVLVGRAIDQDVNLFERTRLQATSERNLFASGLFPMRTPGDVYRAIMIDRLPTFVGVQEVGDFRYLLAAAPVRAGTRDGIVTVPVTLRQQEIERQIDELDRRVLFAAVLFSLLGASLGYWMAERIADPVNRLTRATRRIARGDLDARIAATSSDELRRLVEDFNGMAADLQRQRADLERTQRLEAWADMARQVAHDIKNPLTPIQLSAEHARRINTDRGRPLSPVLDECVNAILGQVTLLRQIASEFSSFASAPTPRPEPTDLIELLREALEPYRTGLADRITIDLQAPPDLPRIPLDGRLFARALTNVVENALHAMPGSGSLAVAVRKVAADTAIVVEVTDTGIGMDAEAIARIFEPYFSTKATGTGLGLTIAKRNVELNGGTIQVRSQRGVGTTVTMRLNIQI